ncbi:Farnesol dehydrogenase [Eumeta japonica]|uniref:Farnesol dehydrogenase n=1 Tax=Eumeta variegata TaxID=151549 RepID=A0A4C1Y4M3_EUMVA|nr:Farnesol dehydrogenase [Eumeta japonica]
MLEHECYGGGEGDAVGHRGYGGAARIMFVIGHKIPTLKDILDSGIYPATKYAVTALCQTLRLEFSYSGLPIRVTSLSPGVVDTKMVQTFLANNSLLENKILKLKPKDAVLYVLSTPDTVNSRQRRTGDGLGYSLKAAAPRRARWRKPTSVLKKPYVHKIRNVYFRETLGVGFRRRARMINVVPTIIQGINNKGQWPLTTQCTHSFHTFSTIQY